MSKKSVKNQSIVNLIRIAAYRFISTQNEVKVSGKSSVFQYGFIIMTKHEYDDSKMEVQAEGLISVEFNALIDCQHGICLRENKYTYIFLKIIYIQYALGIRLQDERELSVLGYTQTAD